jgi:hypothetical protein
MTTLLKVLNNLADIKSAGGVALRVRTQAGRVEGRSANVGDVLAPERECDRRPVFRFAPGLPREPQDRMGDALLDALGRPCRDGPTQGPLLALLKGRI